MVNKKLPAIAGAISNEYMEMAAMNFAMEYYNVYEQFCDFSLSYVEDGRKIVGAIVAAAENLVNKEKSAAEILELLAPVRKEVMDRMEVLTSYTDSFQIHEYLLNRSELKFYDNLPAIDDDEEARKILSFVFEPEDNMEVNLRIKEMVSQLPVRMTSNKFFELVKDSTTVYKNAEKSSLDGFIYMIESAAGIFEPKNAHYYSEFENYKEEFNKINYKELSKEDYDKFAELLAKIGAELKVRTEFIMASQKLINNLYTYFLVSEYTEDNCDALDILKDTINMINEGFRRESFDFGNFKSLDLDVVDTAFSKIEGRPEKYLTKIATSEGRLESSKGDICEVDATAFDNLTMASKLMSSSDFVSFEDADTSECTPEVIEKAAAEIISKLQNAFENKDKQVKRAMMASVLKELPVFFVSHNEVMNYVRVTLSNCRDLAEKTASLKMFWQVYE